MACRAIAQATSSHAFCRIKMPNPYLTRNIMPHSGLSPDAAGRPLACFVRLHRSISSHMPVEIFGIVASVALGFLHVVLASHSASMLSAGTSGRRVHAIMMFDGFMELQGA